MIRKISWLLICALLICSIGVAPAMASTLASAKTTLSGSSDAKINNIELAIDSLDGTYVDYGDYFSFNDVVGPRTSDYGYENATNGRGVKAMGGGVSQVATTLYLALKKLDGIDYDSKKTYGDKFTDNYVSNSSDAILTDYKNDIDFSFDNYYGGFYINMWSDDDYVYCSLDNYSGGNNNSDGDLIGSSVTYIDGSDSLYNNIELAADSIGQYTLGHNDVFSFNDIVGPRTSDYGYENAINGRGVKVCGGGVAQVASTVWLAIKYLDCVKIIEKKTYGDKYNQDYVSSSDDAILTDYTNDIDFSFKYTGYGTLVVDTYVYDDKVVCEIYEY